MDNFWNFLGFLFWTYVFIAYLMVLFSILADLFRDAGLSGWFKAAWIIFLVFFPFLGAIVYLIARGSGMTERHQRRVEAWQGEADRHYASRSAGSPTQDIAEAKELLDAGTITAQEYEALKARALS